MNFASVAGHPVDLANFVGVAIKVPEGGTEGQHVALVYRLSDGTLRMAHLVFHDRLQGAPAPTGDGYAWADCLWLQNPEHAGNAPFVANFIQGTLRNRKVPYGLNPDLECFSTGQHVETDPGYGLTCATYIAAALKGAGFDILDISSWVARPGDQEWSDWVLGLLQVHAPARAAQLVGQHAPFRVRPDEMAAAAAGNSFPTTMDEAARKAVYVRRILSEMT